MEASHFSSLKEQGGLRHTRTWATISRPEPGLPAARLSTPAPELQAEVQWRPVHILTSPLIFLQIAAAMQSSEAGRVQSRLQSQSLQFAGGVGGVGRGGGEEEEGVTILFSNPAPKPRRTAARSLSGELQSPGTTPAAARTRGMRTSEGWGAEPAGSGWSPASSSQWRAYQHWNNRRWAA